MHWELWKSPLLPSPETMAILSLVSLVMVLGSLALLPFVVCWIPEDYFLSKRQPVEQRTGLRILLFVIRNFVGFGLLGAGILMLILPGQGILTMVAGLFVMDFPGKKKIEIWLLRRPGVLPAMNWLRRKRRRADLQLPNKED